MFVIKHIIVTIIFRREEKGNEKIENKTCKQCLIILYDEIKLLFFYDFHWLIHIDIIQSIGLFIH